MKMRQALEFDCRTICDGKRCPYLHPNKDMRLAKTLKMFICRDKNLVIMAEIQNSGKTTEEILSISPFNNCRQMCKLQKEGKASFADFTIYPDGTGEHWNQPIEIT
jgi:hypothetical protein